MKTLLPIVALSALSFGSVAIAQVPTFSNIAYAPDHTRQVLDVWIPATPAGPKPVVVWIHGGGWHTACSPVTAEAQLLGACLGDIQANQSNPNAPWPEKVALAHLAGPVTHVSADDPPFHIAHGTADTTVFPEHSQLLHAALIGQGVDSTLRLVPGAGHGLPLTENAAAIEFFARVLGTPAPCAADFNRDGFNDFFDYLDFVDLFSRGLPAADVNRDGTIDFFDYLDFVDAFSIGC